MVIPSRDKRRPGRRAERGGVEHVVTEPAVRDPLKVRRLNRPAECTACSEPNVVRQDQQNVWSPCGRLHALGKIGRRIFHGAPDFSLKGWLGLWKHYLLGRCAIAPKVSMDIDKIVETRCFMM